eukprot:g7814.t1
MAAKIKEPSPFRFCVRFALRLALAFLQTVSAADVAVCLRGVPGSRQALPSWKRFVLPALGGEHNVHVFLVTPTKKQTLRDHHCVEFAHGLGENKSPSESSAGSQHKFFLSLHDGEGGAGTGGLPEAPTETEKNPLCADPANRVRVQDAFLRDDIDLEAFHDEETPAWRQYAFPLLFDADSKILGGLPFPDYDQLSFVENTRVLRETARWPDLYYKQERHARSGRTYLRRYMRAAPQFFDLSKCEEMIKTFEMYVLPFVQQHGQMSGYDYEEPRLAAIRPYKYGCLIPRGMDWMTGVADLVALCDRKAASVYLRGRLNLLKAPKRFFELLERARRRRSIYNSELFLADALDEHEVPVQRYEARFFRSCAVDLEMEQLVKKPENELLLLKDIEVVTQHDAVNISSSPAWSWSPGGDSSSSEEDSASGGAPDGSDRENDLPPGSSDINLAPSIKTTSTKQQPTTATQKRKDYKGRCRAWPGLGVAGKFEAPSEPDTRVERAKDFWNIFLVPGRPPRDVLDKLKAQKQVYDTYGIQPQYASEQRYNLTERIIQYTKTRNSTRKGSPVYLAHQYVAFRKETKERILGERGRVLAEQSGMGAPPPENPLQRRALHMKKRQELGQLVPIAPPTTSTSTAATCGETALNTACTHLPAVFQATPSGKTQLKKISTKAKASVRNSPTGFKLFKLKSNLTERMKWVGADPAETYDQHISASAAYLESPHRFENFAKAWAGPAREGQQLVRWFYDNALEVNMKAIVWDNNLVLEFGPMGPKFPDGTPVEWQKDLEAGKWMNTSYYEAGTGRYVQDGYLLRSKYREKIFVTQQVMEEDKVLQAQLKNLWDYLDGATACERGKTANLQKAKWETSGKATSKRHDSQKSKNQPARGERRTRFNVTLLTISSKRLMLQDKQEAQLDVDHEALAQREEDFRLRLSVMVFDWDDTLFPNWYVRNVVACLPDGYVNKIEQNPFRQGQQQAGHPSRQGPGTFHLAAAGGQPQFVTAFPRHQRFGCNQSQ